MKEEIEKQEFSDRVPQWGEFEPEKDKKYLLACLPKGVSFGPEYYMSVKCPSCSEYSRPKWICVYPHPLEDKFIADIDRGEPLCEWCDGLKYRNWTMSACGGRTIILSSHYYPSPSDLASALFK